MNEEILWLISSSFRLFLFCRFNQLGVIYLMHKLTARKRSLWVFLHIWFYWGSIILQCVLSDFSSVFFRKGKLVSEFFSHHIFDYGNSELCYVLLYI